MNSEDKISSDNSSSESLLINSDITEINKEESSGNEKQLVVFNLADEEYAIEIHNTREIIEKPEITKIPNSPSFISGLINVRGKIISIIDLGEKFNLENTDGKQILVTEINGEQFGLLIDKVNEITKINEKYIKNPPSILSKKIHLNYLTGVAVLEKRLIIILNIENLLDEKELKESLKESKKIQPIKNTLEKTTVKEDEKSIVNEKEIEKLAEEIIEKDEKNKAEAKKDEIVEEVKTEDEKTIDEIVEEVKKEAIEDEKVEAVKEEKAEAVKEEKIVKEVEKEIEVIKPVIKKEVVVDEKAVDEIVEAIKEEKAEDEKVTKAKDEKVSNKSPFL